MYISGAESGRSREYSEPERGARHEAGRVRRDG